MIFRLILNFLIRRYKPAGRLKAFLLGSLVFAFLISGCTARQPVIPHGDGIPIDPAIVHGRLSNGLGYILYENPVPENRIQMHLDVSAGSIHETNNQQGFAHYLEHMLFNGSTHFKPGELVEYFQSIGMDFGPDANARTGFFNTVYDLNLSKNDEKSISDALLVMDDYSRGALLLPKEVEREKGIILAEMRERDTISYRTLVASLNFMLPGSLLNLRHPIGTRSCIENADSPLLRQFYDQWYRPDHMVLVMVGDFKTTKVEALIKSRFQDFTPRQSYQTPPPDIQWESHQGNKVFYHYEPEAGRTDVSIKTVSYAELTQKTLSDLKTRATRDLADTIINNRLSRMLREKDSAFSNAGIYSDTFLHHVQTAAISATASEGKWEACLKTLEMTLRQALMFGFTRGELEQVRSEMINDLDSRAEKSSTRDSDTIAGALLYQLNDKQLFLSLNQKRDILKPFLNTLTIGDVHQAFMDTWADSHRLITITGDTRIHQENGRTPEQLILETFQESLKDTVVRYQAPPEKKFPYLPDPKTPGEIDSEHMVPDLGISQVTFKNNTRLNFKNTPFKKGEFLFHVAFGNGKKSEPVNRPGISDITEIVIDQSGFGMLDKDEINQVLSGKDLDFNFAITEDRFIISGSAGTRETELVFQLIYTFFLDPGFREQGLTLARKRYQEFYEKQIRTPQGMMLIKGDAFLASHDSRFGMPEPDQIQSISLEDIISWILPALNHSPVEVSVVGDFDQAEVVQAASRYIGNLETRRNAMVSTVERDDPKITSEKQKDFFLDTKIDKSLVQLIFPTTGFKDIDLMRKLSVLARVFEERLRRHIRESLGAAYSPYVYQDSSRTYEDYGMMIAGVTVAPLQAEFIAGQIVETATALSMEGISDQELELVRQPLLSHVREIVKTNDYWLNSVLLDSFFRPEKIEWARTFTTFYSQIQKEDINVLARQYLNSDNKIRVIIQPAAAFL